MAFPRLDKAKDDLHGLRKGLKDVMEEAGAELDMDKVKSISGDRAAKIAWIREQRDQIEKAHGEVKELEELYNIAETNAKDFLEKGDGTDPKGGDGPPINFKANGGPMLGTAFIKSQAFKGRDQGGGKGPTATIEDVDVKTLFQRSAGWDPESVRSGVVVLSAQRPAPHVVNFIPTAPVNQAAYKYMEETTFTNNAAERAEAAPLAESALALTERSKIVESLGTWIPITEEQLEDEEGAEAYVNNRLTFMVQQRLDSQVLLGTGVTPQILGTENVAGIQTQALGADTLIDASYKLFTTIRETAFAEPSVCFVRPSKWQSVMLQKTADGQYIWGHPSSDHPSVLWGVPVVPTVAVTATKLVTGDYTTHALLGIRRGIEMQVTDAHSDYFINLKLAVRAHMRCVMVHYRPAAFGQVTGL